MRLEAAMKLGEKIRYLREVEGSLRGLGRAMTQQELVRAIRDEMGKGNSISQSYFSQIENGARRCFLVLGANLDTPGLADRLLDALRPELAHAGNHRHAASGEGRRIR